MKLLLCSVIAAGGLAAGQDDLDVLEERAFKRAVARIDPSLVRIETIGGRNQVGGNLEASATTTGVIVSADGEILTSAFAFAAQPSSILIRLADGRRFPAQKIATDHLLQLTLLQIDATELVVPQSVPSGEVLVGQWSLATGRTLDPRTPSVSVGIVSAVNRVWGKAIQTDAKVSPVNYGGVLLDIQGRVQGILVPLSPRSEESLAGVEWYDSGIGFAIPMPQALAAAERLRAGNDLKRGLLGVTFDSNALYGQKPQLEELRYDSPAERAGLKKGDVIVAVDGKPTTRIAQVRHALGNKYAGDQVEVEIEREGKRQSHKTQLVAELPPWEPGFLGVLPVRGLTANAQAGVTLRFVFPDSPAAGAGLAAGDIVSDVNGEPVAGQDRLRSLIGRIRPGESAEIGFISGGNPKVASVEIAPIPAETVVSLPDPVLVAPEKKPEAATGRFAETFETHAHDFWAYVPEDYNPDHAYGLLVWLHPAGDTMEARLLDDWREICDSRGLILVAPKAAQPRGWNPNEMPFIRDTIELMQSRYNIDPRRVLVHGYKTSAAVAFAFAFTDRELVRGLVVVGGGLMAPPPENRPEYPLQVYLYCGEKDRRFARARATAAGLRALKYPVTFVNSPASGDEYPLMDQLRAFARWMDSLDRI